MTDAMLTKLRHHHPPGLVALRFPGPLLMVGDRHHRGLEETLDILAAANE